MSEQWGPNKEASGDQVCRAGPGWGLSWLTHTAASVFALYISTLLAAAAWPALLLSLNTVSWVWFGAQQSPENVVLSKLTLIFSRKSQHINIFFDFHSIKILDANIFSSLNLNIFWSLVGSVGRNIWSVSTLDHSNNTETRGHTIALVTSPLYCVVPFEEYITISERILLTYLLSIYLSCRDRNRYISYFRTGCVV